MKDRINTVYDALTYMLQGLHFAETKLAEEFTSCSQSVTSNRIEREIQNYVESSENKVLKLERIFSYLTQDTMTRKNDVIIQLFHETRAMNTRTVPAYLRNVLTIGCIQSINAYKISVYRSAYLFTAELELDTASDLIQQILEWENETAKALSLLSIEEFNKPFSQS